MSSTCYAQAVPIASDISSFAQRHQQLLQTYSVLASLANLIAHKTQRGWKRAPAFETPPPYVEKVVLRKRENHMLRVSLAFQKKGAQVSLFSLSPEEIVAGHVTSLSAC